MAKKRNRRSHTKRRNRKRKNGRQHVPKPADMRLRRLLIPAVGGVREVMIRGSKEASRLGKYWAAVQKYLQTGDDSVLIKFRDKSFADATGKRYSFPTDLKQLDRQASAGVLSFESMYAGGGR